ncbi:MAG TPA: ABC transporter substrate-binding protein [Xanthobacteraceae bacterium]|jgi:ABC-type nitrate/sulfonate/bicarbonate transport system substrate-binding protein
MWMLRSTVAFVLTALISLGLGAADAQTPVTIGKVIGGNGFHIPSYVAMDQGYFKAEGLDARFVSLTGKALVTAALSGNVDFVPIPSGGAQAALSGAEIRYVVGESLKSQWVIVVRKEISKPEDLKGKTVGYGRAGAADYDEGATVLERFFHMTVGKDYKVISFQGEAERMAALINGDIQGALVSTPRVPKALDAGMKVLLRTGDYIPRAGGTIWTRKAYVDQHPDTVKKVIRAIAKGVTYFRDNRAGSIPILKGNLGIQSDQEAGVIWDQLHNTFGAEIPKELFREIFEARRQTMIAANQWAKDKPLPDPEQFLTRDLLDSTLKEMGYVPTKLAAPSN